MIIDFGNDGKGGGASCELQEVAITYTTNGINELVPDVGFDGISKATVTVDVPDKPVDARKTVDIVENGTIEIDPGAGYDSLAGATVYVNVPIPSEPVTTLRFKDFPGLKMIKYTKNLVPDNFDLNGITDMSYFFQDSRISEIPYFDASQTSNFKGMCSEMELLKTFPAIDISSNNGSLYEMFQYCFSLTTIPLLDTSNVTNFSYFIRGSRIRTIPKINTSKAQNVYYMFRGCESLESVPELDFSSVNYVESDGFHIGDPYSSSNQLKTLGGFKGMRCSINLEGQNLLDKPSLMNVINKMGNADPNIEAQPKLTLSATCYALLSEADIAIATGKGWTVVQA